MAPHTPRVIALASSKGGNGKSVLTANLAVRAVKEGGRVALIDAEPQQSLTLWWQLRGNPDNPFLYTFSGDVSEDADKLRADGYDWIFIDTMPADLPQIQHAIDAADFVVVPTRVSMFDLAATRTVVGLCGGKRRFAFVLNATDPAWKKGIQSALAVLKRMGPVIPKSIRQRTVYASTLTAGKTGPEGRDVKEAKAAADEIGAVWAAVKKMALAKTRGK